MRGRLHSYDRNCINIKIGVYYVAKIVYKLSEHMTNYF